MDMEGGETRHVLPCASSPSSNLIPPTAKTKSQQHLPHDTTSLFCLLPNPLLLELSFPCSSPNGPPPHTADHLELTHVDWFRSHYETCSFAPSSATQGGAEHGVCAQARELCLVAT